jgi:hypothetical protein
MLIELCRKVLADDYNVCCCAICGNDFDRGSVFAVASTDDGGDMGEVCPTCLDYLSRRKNDADDWRVRENWPAREWPTLEDLQDARRRYPEPMFTDDDAMTAATGGDPEVEDGILQSSFIWRMEPEREGAR